MTIAETLARFALNLRYQQIPQPALQEARRFLLDSVGCAMAGLQNEDMAAEHRYIENLGGAPRATVMGTGFKTDAANAALMNSLLIRALDDHDIYWKQDPSHPSDVIPAALPTVEPAHRDVQKLLVGIVTAYK